MTKTCSHLLFISVFLIVCSTAKAASAETFPYSGYLESDSVRAATMNLSVSGQTVTGNLTLNPVCQSNARLPGGEFNLSGDVNGQWEGKGSISGTWTGVVRWCDNDENRSGTFSISLGQGSVYFSATGSYYNRYVFTALGKVSDPAVSSGPSTDGGNSVKEVVLHEPSGFGALGPPRKGFNSGVLGLFGWGDDIISSTIQMKINETQTIESGDVAWQAGYRSRTGQLSNCTYNDFNVDGAIRETKRTERSVTIWAKDEGIGRIYKRKTCRWTPADGESKIVEARGIVLVLVGDRAVEDYTGKQRPPNSQGYDGPTPDIAKAALKGRVVMVGTKKPVPNAQMSLLSSRGGTYYQDNWKSGSDGTFSFRADNMLISGVYEVMAQLRSAEMGTTADPSTVNKDLWPVKKYHVTIARDSALKGSIDVGDIEMDTVLKIFGGWDTDNNTIVEGSGRDTVENRTPVTKSSQSEQPVINEKPTSSGYNPLGDPNLKSPTSRNPTDVAAVDKLGNDFHDGYGKTKKPDQNSQQAPINQPDSYTGSVKKDDPGNAQPTPPTGYSPHDSPQYSGSGYDYPRGDGGNTGTSSRCDSSQKRSASLAGFQCGKKAKQNNGTMTRDCASALQTYRSIDMKSGWGSCLSGAFDLGYREGLAQVSRPQSPSTPQTSSKITAEFENKAGDNVHIFVEGQDNFGPHNRLGPGQKRTITLNISAGQTIQFVAGRNGQVLARCNWTPNSGSSGGTAYARFSGSSTLTCTTK